jgi:two-component system, OmpR family, sensor kinase
LQGELELARRPGRTRAELAATIDVAAEETDRLVRLAEDLLVLGRDCESPVRRGRPFDLSEIAEAAIHAAAASAAVRDVEIALSAPRELTVIGDPDRIRQAVDNLLTNAVRHSPSGARVAVSLEVDGPQAQVEVTDQGPGFAPEFIPVAFERFTRADQARGRTTGAGVPGGMGLGLAIVRAVMVSHGGSATAANATGAGARVTLRWPTGRPDGSSATLTAETSP